MNENGTLESHEPDDEPAISLRLFHEAQQAAMSHDQAASIAKLEESLVNARGEKEPDAEWIAYIMGTLSYLKEDISGLREQITDAGNNALILSRLAKGLERRGTCDYKEDYGA